MQPSSESSMQLVQRIGESDIGWSYALCEYVRRKFLKP